MQTLSNLLQPHQLHGYQQRAVNHQCTLPETMMWMDMGLGKTIVTETSIVHLLRTRFLRGVLVVAPIRVVRLVWRQEAAKWEHTKDLTFSVVAGDKDSRIRALMRPADIYLINYENLGWLANTLFTYFISQGRPLPFDGIVWDEISKMKNSTSKRVQSFLRIINHFKWATGLTGTPASNGYKDLHGQYLVVDKGKRLGVHKTPFKTEFFFKQGPHKEVPFADSKEKIKERIGDITLEMSAEDYNKLPDLIVNDVEVELEDHLRVKYEILEEEMFLQLDSGKDVEAFNQASLMNKCLQFGQGAIYPVPQMPMWEHIHDAKLDALEDIIDEAQGSPVLVAYQFRHDADRIMKRFAHLNPVNLTECKSEKSLNEAMARWKAGLLPLLVGHPASMGHGIDGLQHAGNIIVWFGLTWSLDFYDQMNARLRRQGQGKPVICHRIVMSRSVDQVQAAALSDKDVSQKGLRKAIKDYRISKGV